MQSRSRELVAELVAATPSRPELADAFSTLFAERRAAAFKAVERGIARGTTAILPWVASDQQPGSCARQPPEALPVYALALRAIGQWARGTPFCTTVGGRKLHHR
jgi:hypothetical protein